MQKKTVRLVLISLLSAIAFVLMMLEFPIFAAIPGLQHLKLDFGDVPAAFAGALLSPGVGVVVELIKTSWNCSCVGSAHRWASAI